MSMQRTRPAASRRRNAATAGAARLFALLSWCVSACVGLGCGTAQAQGFPGGGEHGGRHAGHGAPPDAGRRSPAAEAGKPAEPLEQLLRAAHELRQDLVLDEAQTKRWSQMQDDLRDALDKRRALAPKLADATQVPNAALLYVQDLRDGARAFSAALERASQSMQAAWDALNERQKKACAERMTLALSNDAPR